jgi:hypothetical protein
MTVYKFQPSKRRPRKKVIRKAEELARKFSPVV